MAIGAGSAGRRLGSVFRTRSGPMFAELWGATQLIDMLTNLVVDDRTEEAAQNAAAEVYHEAYRLVPEDTGELVDEIEIIRYGPKKVGVGVPRASPAYAKAVATEYGAATYDVGSPTNPKRDWPAKSKVSASMPWLRVAMLRARKNAFDAIRQTIFGGNTRR